MSEPIYITNRSTLVSDHDVRVMAAAIHAQVDRHFNPAWGLSHTRIAYREHAEVAQSSRVIAVVDTLDEADALGYHTDDARGEWGVVGVKVVLDNGGKPLIGPYSVASVLSHEVLELLADPFCTSWSDSGHGFLVATEVADPVQSDVYYVDGVSVSNFVFPSWFDANETHGPFDYLCSLQRPFTLGRGGYWVQMSEGKVSYKFGEHMPEWLRQVKRSRWARASRRAVSG